jgi:hypothetical protein
MRLAEARRLIERRKIPERRKTYIVRRIKNGSVEPFPTVAFIAKVPTAFGFAGKQL